MCERVDLVLLGIFKNIYCQEGDLICLTVNAPTIKH